FRKFVDPVYGEVWNSVDGRTHMPIRVRPKQWQWKNAYHSFEHALVGYITSQQLDRNLVTLYYAFPDDTTPNFVQPYYFSGQIESIAVMTDSQGRRLQRIGFSNIR